MRLFSSCIAGSVVIQLLVVALLVSCRRDDPDVRPVVPEGAVDMGIVMTR